MVELPVWLLVALLVKAVVIGALLGVSVRALTAAQRRVDRILAAELRPPVVPAVSAAVGVRKAARR